MKMYVRVDNFECDYDDDITDFFNDFCYDIAEDTDVLIVEFSFFYVV